MNESASDRGAGTHEGSDCILTGEVQNPYPDEYVCACSFRRDIIQFAGPTTGWAFTQRSRGLDLAESPPKGGGEARGSGIRRPEGAERLAVAVTTPERRPQYE